MHLTACVVLLTKASDTQALVRGSSPVKTIKIGLKI